MNLIEIAKLPTAENSAIQLHPSDDIAVARVPIAAGTELKIAGQSIVVRDDIPAGHKLALADKPSGGMLHRYGQLLGRATHDIQRGQHVHVHNLSFEELVPEYEFPATDVPFPPPPASMPTFRGYLREDGRVGTRNYVAIVAASNCAAHTAQLIANSFANESLPDNVDGVIAFPHGDGCGLSDGEDGVQMRRTLGGILDHPNISSAIILGLGCEVNQIDHYLGPRPGGAPPRSNRLVGMTVQASGGTRATVDAARPEVQALIDQAAAESRVDLPASKLVLGLNCGGSDSFSGITANPALGACSDILAAIGATAVLAETPEVFGAEHLLIRRARNRAVAERFLGFVQRYKRYLQQFGRTFDDNLSPGNKHGGLTNVIEKSLGATAKAGTSTMTDAIEYAERIQTPGFVFMNTPGYDPVSVTGLAAGGCNLVAFTTGRGSALGFPSVPVLKIASNSATFHRMRDNMDINAGAVADGEKTIEQVGREIFDALLRVASGERTCAELMGHQEFVLWKIGPFT